MSTMGEAVRAGTVPERLPETEGGSGCPAPLTCDKKKIPSSDDSFPAESNRHNKSIAGIIQLLSPAIRQCLRIDWRLSPQR
jgi:hypothetical protein